MKTNYSEAVLSAGKTRAGNLLLPPIARDYNQSPSLWMPSRTDTILLLAFNWTRVKNNLECAKLDELIFLFWKKVDFEACYDSEMLRRMIW